MAAAARQAGLTEALLRWAPSITIDRAFSASENPGPRDLASAQVAICGVPRSGTTFLGRAADVFLGDPGAAWKTHDPYIWMDFIPQGKPVIIALRDPLDTAVSKVIYHGDEVTPVALMRRLALTTAWLRIMARQPHHDLMRVCEFADFTADPQGTLEARLQLQPVGPVIAGAIRADVDAEDRHHGVDTLQSHGPNDRRDGVIDTCLAFADHRSVRRRIKQAVEAQERVRQNHGA